MPITATKETWVCDLCGALMEIDKRKKASPHNCWVAFAPARLEEFEEKMVVVCTDCCKEIEKQRPARTTKQPEAQPFPEDDGSE